MTGHLLALEPYRVNCKFDKLEKKNIKLKVLVLTHPARVGERSKQ